MKFPQNGAAGATVLIVAAGSRSTPAAARSLAAAGYRVVGIHHARIYGRSRHLAETVLCPRLSSDPDGFLAVVEAEVRRHGAAAVLSLGEPETRTLAEELPHLGSAALVGPDAEQYAALCDKATLARAAARTGLAYPEGIVVGADGTDGPWPALPSIVKARCPGHPALAGAMRTQTTIVRTARERDDAVRALSAAVGEVLVQELVGGRHWRVHFVRASHGFGAVSSLTLRRYPPGTGPASVSRPHQGPPGLVAAVRLLLDLVDYRGPGEVELIEREGRLYVHDVNLRLSASVAEAICAGLDVPRLAIDSALGLAPDLRPSATGFGTWVSLPGEAAHLLDALRRQGRGTTAPRIAADLILAALSPSRMLDPLALTDPLPAVGSLVDGAARLVSRQSNRPRAQRP